MILFREVNGKGEAFLVFDPNPLKWVPNWHFQPKPLEKQSYQKFSESHKRSFQVNDSNLISLIAHAYAPLYCKMFPFYSNSAPNS